jgi:quinol monooxygenase YgiN
MIKRIVKMEFKEDKINAFIYLIEKNRNKITKSNGCISLEILQDINDKNVFFTYSCWNKEEDLHHYRKSALFNEVWSETKTYFNNKPLAWSVSII